MRVRWIFIILIPLVIFYSCSKIESGTIDKCKYCGKTIQSDIKTSYVPIWDVERYSTKIDYSVCNACDSDLIEYKNDYFCKNCGTNYNTEIFYATKSEGKSNSTIRNEYCDKCKNILVYYLKTIECPRCHETYTLKVYYHLKDSTENMKNVIYRLCSSCEKIENITESIKQAGEVTGELGGSFIEGMVEGIEKILR